MLAIALLGFSILLLMTLIPAALTPGYSHASQFISELGATGASFEKEVRFFGFLPVGILLSLFTVGAYRSLPRSATFTLTLIGIFLFAIGYIGAAFFPCDAGCRPAEPSFSQMMHNALGGIGYLLAPGFLLLFGFATRRWQSAGAIPLVAFIGAAISLFSLPAITPDSPIAGLSQRLLELSVWLPVLLSAFYGVRRRPHATEPSTQLVAPLSDQVTKT